LAGTCKWYAERTKAQMLSKGEVPNFRTKAARQKRDKRLLREVGFLHCAFRYRVKANYRDAIYLTYGEPPPAFFSQFIGHLAASARFAAIYALAFAERRVGAKPVKLFVRDLTDNLWGMASAQPSELFWQQVLR
jgi:hypothetical protein